MSPFPGTYFLLNSYSPWAVHPVYLYRSPVRPHSDSRPTRLQGLYGGFAERESQPLLATDRSGTITFTRYSFVYPDSCLDLYSNLHTYVLTYLQICILMRIRIFTVVHVLKPTVTPNHMFPALVNPSPNPCLLLKPKPVTAHNLAIPNQ